MKLMNELKKIEFPKNVTFGQTVEIQSISFYPIRDKDFKKINVLKKLNMIMTIIITPRFNDVLLPTFKKVLRQEIDEKTVVEILKKL